MVWCLAWTLLLASVLVLCVPSLARAATPHSGNDNLNTCSACHVPHQAATKSGIFRDRGLPAAETTTCYYCHDGSGALGNVKTGADSFAGNSGHVLEAITDSEDPVDLTNTCSGCHVPHADPALRPKLPGTTVNGVEITAAGNDWCLACHNDAQDWYATRGTYPSVAEPSRDETGYPVLGTFAGATTYRDVVANPHAAIPASTEPTRSAGDCLYCHNAHGSVNGYDALNKQFRPSTPLTVVADRADGTYAEACFQCHGGGTWETRGAPNIKQFATFGAAETDLMANGGHRIKSAGGTLPVNAPLPCYNCHNPHGSSRGNTKLLSDELGGGLDTAAGPEAVRRFCLTCHVTSEQLGWDSDASAYVPVAADDTVEGLLRNGGAPGSGPDGGYNWLLLKVTPGHQAADTSMSCYECHGNDYGAADANNVHNPGSYSVALHTGTPSAASISIKGVSYGPFTCSQCHNVELGPEHDKPSSSSNADDCSACHPTPRTSLTPNWDRTTCAQGDCHTVSTSAPMHAEADADHDAPAVTCTAAGCHLQSAGLAVLHEQASVTVEGVERTSCAVCHAGGVPSTNDCETCHGADPHPVVDHTVSNSCATAECHGSNTMTMHETGPGCAACHSPSQTKTFDCATAGCHPGVTGHGDQTATHAATVTAGWIEFFGEGSSHAQSESGPIDTYVTCSTCHFSNNLLNVHANDCSICHLSASAPRDTFGTWNGSCQQGACHPTFHANASPGHDSEYNWDCDTCHDFVGWDGMNWDGIATEPFCGYCHTGDMNPDVSPPTTSGNFFATYIGDAAITFTVNDNRAVRATYYILDGGPVTKAVGPVVVPAPPSGSESHTIEFWSVDWSGNVETHKTRSFSISPDTVAPVTTSDAKAAYSGPVTIKLTPTDNATVRGVMYTYYRLDDGPLHIGTVISLPQPSSGTESRTLTFWSVDYAGNVEEQKSASFTMTADNTPPIVSLNISGGATYATTYSVTLNLSASDPGGSGVTQMRFSHDGTNWQAWETYATTKQWWLLSGNGTKIVYVQVRDLAGNTTTASDTIVVDTVGPTGSILVNNGAASTAVLGVTLNLSASDTLSGVTQMRFSNGGTSWSGWQPYATTADWTLATGSGVKTVYVQFMDGAGNTRQYSDSIQLTATDATAPTGSIVINAGAASTTSLNVTLTLTASDTGGSGLADMRFSNDGSTWTMWEPFNASKSWMLTSGPGTKTVWVQYRDNVGNISSSYLDTISAFVDATVTYVAGPGGTIQGTTPQSVTYGGSGTEVVAVPDPGYRFLAWNDGPMTANRTDTGVTSDRTYTAWFAPEDSHTVRFLSSGWGDVGGQWIQGIPTGGSTTAVTAEPYGGYSFMYWWNGTTTNNSQTLVVNNVTADQTYTAFFMESGSCPFLYTWDGVRFQFEADEFAAGYLGLRTSKGYRRPNPLDYHMLEHTPQPKAGALEYKLVEERDEVDYLDQAKLYTVDAPGDRDVWIERSQAEGLGKFTTLEAVIHTTAKNLQPPPSVRWVNTGQDVRDKVATSDKEYVVLNTNRNADFNYQTLELDLGDVQHAPMVKLVIDGRTMIPTSPEGRAYSRTFGPQVKFEVQDANGAWVAVPSSTAILPKPPEFDRPFVLDLTNIWVSESRKVRLTYLYKTYIDAILLDTTADEPVTLTELPMVSANLQPHGFNFRVGIGELYEYRYGTPLMPPNYKLPGYYTKFGDVTPLLGEIDDKFVIFGGGDEITLRFQPPSTSADGLTRRYLFLSNGYYKTLKEDISHTVEPLPFAAMSNFPYPDTESYPTDADHQNYLATWNTRWEGYVDDE